MIYGRTKNASIRRISMEKREKYIRCFRVGGAYKMGNIQCTHPLTIYTCISNSRAFSSNSAPRRRSRGVHRVVIKIPKTRPLNTHKKPVYFLFSSLISPFFFFLQTPLSIFMYISSFSRQSSYCLHRLVSSLTSAIRKCVLKASTATFPFALK